MGLQLKVVAGPADGVTIEVGDEPFVIGRAEDGDGKLGDDSELSRRHARVSLVGETLRVEDLGSTNGTFVNGSRIDQATELRPGDSLSVGGTSLVVEGSPDQQGTRAGAQVTKAARQVTRAAPIPAGGESSEAFLVVVAGPGAGLRIPLGTDQFVIGRAEVGDATLGDDLQISRRHARISEFRGRVVLEDFGSTNGTFVNGRRIGTATEVQPGDSIWMGATTLVLETPERPAPAVPPAEPPAPAAESGLLSRFADLTDRYPARILVAVGVFFVFAVIYGGQVSEKLNTAGFHDPDAESLRTDDRIAEASGEVPGAQLLVLVKGDQPVDSAATREEVERLEAEVRQEVRVARTVTFYNTRDKSLVSKNGRLTYIAVFFKDSTVPEYEDASERIRERIETPPEVELGGGALAYSQLEDQVEKDLAKAETLVFPLLAVLVLFVFRGAVAALLPLFVGLLTMVTTFVALRLVNEVVGISPFALNIVVGLGLGLSIDYSLFIVSRYREELARVGRGRGESRLYGASETGGPDSPFAGTKSEALRRTLYTAGRTVLYSGLTVAVALAALMIFPQPFIYSMGIGGTISALAAVAVSLVALPALLSVLGHRVNSLAPKRWQQATRRTASVEKEGLWYRLSQTVMRRPATVAAVSGALLIAVGLPFLNIEFTGIDGRMVPNDLTPRKVEDTIRAGFAVNPQTEITVLADAPRASESQIDSFARELRSRRGVHPTGLSPKQLKGGLWEIQLLPKRTALDNVTINVVEDLRERNDRFPVTVTGETARFLDQKKTIGDYLPLAGLLLCGATLSILFLMTGSIVLPIKSLLMNALSLSAAFGLLVVIFQYGNLEGLLSFESQGALEISQLVLLFALGFGLATDYGVFLLTRIKEARMAGASEKDAVAFGLERTGRIVTQAALLFCIAIGVFATSSVVFVKQVGLGTALAVLIDATVIRAFLVPSLMALLGARNWWAPGPLRRLHNKIGLTEG